MIAQFGIVWQRAGQNQAAFEKAPQTKQSWQIKQDDRVSKSLLTIGDGLTLILKEID